MISPKCRVVRITIPAASMCDSSLQTFFILIQYANLKPF